MINDVLLVCAAIIPAIVFAVYIYKRDRVEKEPVGLLLLLFGLGVAICFPAAELETLFSQWLRSAYEDRGRVVEGVLQLPTDVFREYMFYKAFFGVALVEEGLKFVVLLLITKGNKNFNSLFDGIIYAVFVSLGFAAYENILYVLKYGWLTAYSRAVMSVPGHTFFAVLMGYHYSLWNVYKKARKKEKALLSQGLLSGRESPFRSGHHMVLSFVVPILAHGFYDYCCFVDTLALQIILKLFVLFLYGYCFFHVSRMSQKDKRDKVYADSLVRKKYPHLYVAQEESF